MLDSKENLTGTAPVSATDITRIVALRNASLETLHRSVDTLDAVFNETAAVRKDLAGVLRGNGVYAGNDTHGSDAIFGRIHDVERSKASLRRSVDRAVWRGLMDLTGFHRLMDTTERERFERQLEGDDVPEVTEATVRATFASLFQDADLIFKRGIATAFSRLDRRFKSHDGFKVGSRIIIPYAFDQTFGSATGGRAWSTIADIERAFSVLDGVAPDPRALERAVDESRRGTGYGPKQSTATTRYFTLRGYMNGNAHLWFNRDDLVEKVNRLLHDYYGDVLPDAWETASQDAERATKTHSTAVSKDLQFYATPKAVCDALVRDGLHIKGARVLEPSAGEGAIADAALRAGAARVDCFEVDRGRADAIVRRFNGLVAVACENFLDRVQDPVYDIVLMNPPFYGTHYMQHVRHAFGFLKKGGVLRAVLPATVEFGETKAHVDFRAWAEKRMSGSFRVFDLPDGAFRESGTNVQTCILELVNR